MRQARTLGALKDYPLFARDGQVGKLRQVYFDDEQWVVRYFVVHAGSWLFGRDVLIAPDAVIGVNDDSGRIELDLALEQIEKAPPVNTELPVSRHYEIEYHRHFGLPPYWAPSIGGAPLTMPPAPPPPDAPAEPVRDPESPHLRDSAEVIGYRLQARDGELGHIHDLVLDDETWAVRYFVVDTGTWLPGRKVLIAPTWIERVSWAEHAMVVDLERDLIRTAPAYEPGRLIGHDDEVRLYAHYGKSVQQRDASAEGSAPAG